MDASTEAAAIVRRDDPDRYFADLFAPAEARAHLLVLHAFNAEIARVADMVSEPLPGEIRLQWWRDAIARHDAGGHPLATALLQTIERCRLPREAFDRYLEARIFDLYDDPMPDMAAFEAYAGNTASALFQLGAIILAGGREPGTADAAGHAGVAYALTGLMRALPANLRRGGQLFLPADHLGRRAGDDEALREGKPTPALERGLAVLRGEARSHHDKAIAGLGSAVPEARAAFLPLALIEPNLRAQERVRDPLAQVVELPLWRRQWILWRAARRSSFLDVGHTLAPEGRGRET